MMHDQVPRQPMAEMMALFENFMSTVLGNECQGLAAGVEVEDYIIGVSHSRNSRQPLKLSHALSCLSVNTWTELACRTSPVDFETHGRFPAFHGSLTLSLITRLGWRSLVVVVALRRSVGEVRSGG